MAKIALWVISAVALASLLTGDGIRWPFPGWEGTGWSGFDAVVLAILAIGFSRSHSWPNIIKLLVGIGLVAWLWAHDNLSPEKFSGLKDGWPWFVAAQGLFLGCFVITILRWRLLLSALGVSISAKDGVRLGMVGLFFNQFAPGGTGGDLVKAYYAAREHPESRPEAILSVVLDRVIGLTGLMVLAGIVLLSNFDLIWQHEVLRWLGFAVAAGAAGVVLAGALLAWPRIWRKPAIRRIYDRLPGRALIARVAHALWEMRGKRKILIACLLLSVLNHSMIVFTHVLLVKAVQAGEVAPDLAVFFFAVPIGLLAIALPLTPGGWGVGEVAYQKLFEQFGYGGGSVLAILIRATWLIWGMVGLGFYLVGRHGIRAALDEAERLEDLEAGALASEATADSTVGGGGSPVHDRSPFSRRDAASSGA